MNRIPRTNVRIVVPTDFEILEEMRDGERYTAALIGDRLSRKKSYMRTRFQDLKGHGLISQVESSSMYTITPVGHAALDLRDEYAHERSAEWGEEVRELAAETNE